MGYGLGRESACNKAAVRTVLLASMDAHFKSRMRHELTAMRWQVREASGGAETIALLEKEGAEALVLDNALPDLEVGEFARQMRSRHPVMDLLRAASEASKNTTRPILFYTAAGAIYLVFSILSQIGQSALERRANRGYA